MKKKIGMRKVGIRVVEKKHFHIAVSGTYSIKADTSEGAVAKVEAMLEAGKITPIVLETDDNEHCDYCPETKAIKLTGHFPDPID